MVSKKRTTPVPKGIEPPARGELQVVSRCAEVLRLFTPTRSDLRTADVARDLGLQRTTVHRYLVSMVRAGLLSRTEDGSYGIGPLPLQLTTIAFGGRHVLEEADAYMARLAAESHETVVLSVWGGLEPVVVKVHEDMSSAVTVSVRVGTRLPLDAAQSVLFLGLLPDRHEVDRLLGRLPAALADDLRVLSRVAAERYVSINSRFVRGVRAIAAPVFGPNGLLATMAVVGMATAIPEDPESPIARALQASTADLSGRLGGEAFWIDRYGADS